MSEFILKPTNQAPIGMGGIAVNRVSVAVRGR